MRNNLQAVIDNDPDAPVYPTKRSRSRFCRAAVIATTVTPTH